MATQRSAEVYLTNATDGTARLRLTHHHRAYGSESGSWVAGPGQTVGPLVVHFTTGFASRWAVDRWTVTMSVRDGSAPGIYQNTETSDSPHWTECRLRREDAGRRLEFRVSTSAFDPRSAAGACSDAMKRIADYSPVTNVFVLMLENRSFDHMFGRSGIEGLTVAPPDASNTYDGTTYPVATPAPTALTADPGHEFRDVVEQLAGPGATYVPGSPYPSISMSGFAANYATSTTEGTPLPAPEHVGDIMRSFDTRTQLPTSFALATQFAICDHWFSAMPGPTWPNRMFVHAASSAGLDHSPTTAEIVEWEAFRGLSFPHGTIFDALSAADLGWRVYNDDTNAYSDDPRDGLGLGAIPQVAALKGVTLHDVHPLSRFADDLQGPYPYQYTFIEPDYGDITGGSYAGGSSQHPMDDVYGGEALIKGVYEAVRRSPLWPTSLLVVTYDEHGGLYDSVAPAGAPAPDDGSGDTYNASGFTFDRLGVRVPAIVVSPLIAAGSVDHTVYDHTSVLKTVETLFGLPALTARDAAANDLVHLLALETARSDCPLTLPEPVPAMARPERGAAQAEGDQRQFTGGNLPGFLAVAHKAAAETYATTPRARKGLTGEYRAIRTREEARAFLGKVGGNIRRAKRGRR